MAQKLGVTSAFLSAVENGRKSAPSTWLQRLTELYSLTPQQQNELSSAFSENVKQVRISLESAQAEQRDLAISFARRFDELDHKEIEAVMRILNKKHQQEEN